jgi:hypothetical protein
MRVLITIRDDEGAKSTITLVESDWEQVQRILRKADSFGAEAGVLISLHVLGDDGNPFYGTESYTPKTVRDAYFGRPEKVPDGQQ